MRQERLPAAGRRPRAGAKQRQQGSGGVGNIISNVLRKRNGISRSAPRLLCTLEPGDPSGTASHSPSFGFRHYGNKVAQYRGWIICKPGVLRGTPASCGSILLFSYNFFPFYTLIVISFTARKTACSYSLYVSFHNATGKCLPFYG